MFNCRYKESPTLPKPLHVHDNPGYVEDALRNRDLFDCVHLDVCLHPEVPFVQGDTEVVVYTVVDALHTTPDEVYRGDK